MQRLDKYRDPDVKSGQRRDPARLSFVPTPAGSRNCRPKAPHDRDFQVHGYFDADLAYALGAEATLQSPSGAVVPRAA